MASVIGSFKTGQKDATNLAELFDKMQIAVVGRDDGHESDAVSSGSSDNEGDEELKTMYDDNVVSQKHMKHSEMEVRAAEDMDFPDEVDTPFKEARVRFQKYRAVKNLKHADWDPFENLPDSYSKIWRFQNYQAAQKDSITQTIEEGLPLNGTFITIVLQLDPEKKESQYFTMSQAVILSTLFPHECKLSTMHFKIKRTLESKEVIPSKTLMEFHCGFRRLKL